MIREQRYNVKLRLCTWNINAVRTKLDKDEIRSFFNCVDIICLNEIKTQIRFTIPGYVSYINAQDSNRGGVAVLVRKDVNRLLSHVDYSTKDQIRFQLKCWPRITFIACYIPPEDSPYFNLDSIASLSSTFQSDPEMLFVVLGDLNCRYGELCDRFLETSDMPWSYRDITDTKPNRNAKRLIDVLESLIMLNGLDSGKTVFSGDKTYRQGSEWKSTLDHVYVSESLVSYVEDFSVRNDAVLPSDHAPVFFSLTPECRSVGMDKDELQLRSGQLGSHEFPQKPVCKKQIRWEHMDSVRLESALSEIAPPEITPGINGFDINTTMTNINDTVFAICEQSLKSANTDAPTSCDDNYTWSKLLESNDSKEIWKAIDWSGKIGGNVETDRPTDDTFKIHFETLLNPDNAQLPEIVDSGIHMPITDEPIQPREVSDAIETIKPNKSGGPSGISPGILKTLPVNWIIFLAGLFTIIFYSATLPVSWCVSRLIVLFKKGSKNDCNNYRGISVMDTFGKLYDLILCRRLEMWMKPSREQAGAQKGRGCTEQILGLRLLFDYAISRKKKLYMVFVDFSKAYDKVPRRALINSLISLGCGTAMVMAIAALYGDTQMVLGSAMIATSIGIRQGSPTSCWLFTVYIDKFVRMIRSSCPNDGFLGWLHCLLLMDDTIILSTTRDGLKDKMEILLAFCDESGMVINQGKTKTMIINGNENDRASLEFPELTVKNCDQYVYLGTIFTQDGKVKSAVTAHIRSKKSNIMKFIAFLNKNVDFPFPIKKKVMESALISSVFYGCEAWLNNSSRLMEVSYRSMVKALLGVRTSTPNDVCLLETDLCSAEARVKDVQRKFMCNILSKRTGMKDDPFMHIWNICKNANTSGYKYLAEVIDSQFKHSMADKMARAERVRKSDKLKSKLYVESNPLLTVHPIYTDTNVREHERIAATRLRLSSHDLAVERGRWTRTPFDECKCPCGHVQTVEHLLCSCPRNDTIREQYRSTIDFTKSQRFWESENPAALCRYAYEAVEIASK